MLNQKRGIGYLFSNVQSGRKEEEDAPSIWINRGDIIDPGGGWEWVPGGDTEDPFDPYGDNDPGPGSGLPTGGGGGSTPTNFNQPDPTVHLTKGGRTGPILRFRPYPVRPGNPVRAGQLRFRTRVKLKYNQRLVENAFRRMRKGALKGLRREYGTPDNFQNEFEAWLKARSQEDEDFGNMLEMILNANESYFDEKMEGLMLLFMMENDREMGNHSYDRALALFKKWFEDYQKGKWSIDKYLQTLTDYLKKLMDTLHPQDATAVSNKYKRL